MSVGTTEKAAMSTCLPDHPMYPCGAVWSKFSRLILIFVTGLGVSCIIKPLMWLLATRLTKRYSKLAYLEIVLDFELALAWMVVFALELGDHGFGDGRNLGGSGILAISELFKLMLDFMCLNAIFWLTSGIMNSRELIKARRQRNFGQSRRSLIGNELEHQPDRLAEPRPSAASSHYPNIDDKPRDLALGKSSHETPRQPESAVTASPYDYFNIARVL